MHKGPNEIGRSWEQQIWERWANDPPFRNGAIVIGGGSLLLIILGRSLETMPFILTAAIPFIILGVYGVIRFPAPTLIGMLGGRVLIDMTWWAPSVAGVNSNELYSGLYAVLSMILFLLYIRIAQQHFFFIPLILFTAVLTIGALQDSLFLMVPLKTTAEWVARSLSPILAMMLVTALLLTDRGRRACVYVIPIAGVVPIIIAYYHYFNGQMSSFYLDGYYRLLGGYANLHNQAHAMALFLTMSPFLFYAESSQQRRLIALIYGLLASFILYFTYVRTTQVGFVVFFIAFLVAERRFATLLILSALTLPILTQSEVFANRFGELLALITGDHFVDRSTVGSGRLDLWKVGLDTHLRRSSFQLFFGGGSDGAINPYHGNVTLMDSHNDYLALLMCMGPLGLIIYLLFQGQIFYAALRVRSLTRSHWWRTFANYMIGLNLLVAVTNFVSNSYVSRFSMAMCFWTLAGVLFAKYGSLAGLFGLQKVPEVLTPEDTIPTPSLPPWMNVPRTPASP